MKFKRNLPILLLFIFCSLIQAKEHKDHKLHKKIIEGTHHAGHFRYRYQIQDLDKDDIPQRVRNRILFRYSVGVNLDKKTSIHAGIGSGTATSKSGNATLDNSFDSKAVYLDFAYAKFNTSYGKWMMGKMKNPLNFVSDMMWDKDIRPEGVAYKFRHKRSGVGLTGAYFQIQENEEANNDPSLIVLQAHKKQSLRDNLMIKVLGTVHSFDNTKGRHLPYSGMTNTGTVNTSNKTNAYDYNPHIVSLASKIMLKDLKTINSASIFGEYNKNTACDEKNIAALVGVGVGKHKIKNKKDWKAEIQYRHIQKDGLVDILTDYDTFRGGTNVKGIELIFKYGLFNNVTLGLDYISMQELSTDQVEQILQTDISVRF